jgi:hypothetical protein
MNAIEILVAKTALKKMVEQGYFCICTIDKVLKISGGIPDPRDYQMLSALHCVHYKDMPPTLLRELPNIIKRVVESPTYQFYIDISPSNDTLALTCHE